MLRKKSASKANMQNAEFVGLIADSRMCASPLRELHCNQNVSENRLRQCNALYSVLMSLAEITAFIVVS